MELRWVLGSKGEGWVQGWGDWRIGVAGVIHVYRGDAKLLSDNYSSPIDFIPSRVGYTGPRGGYSFNRTFNINYSPP